MTINQFIDQAIAKLSNQNISSARLDVFMIASFILDKPKEWLLINGSQQLSSDSLELLNEAIKKRINKIPVAYITGYKWFYGHKFKINNKVLVPRPESEVLVDEASRVIKDSSSKILDVGTGSGCLAISVGLKHPNANITACDISDRALSVAKENALNLGSKIKFIQSNLLSNVDKNFDVIIANLPYISRTWTDLSPELKAEPELALYAADNGLALIKKLIKMAPDHLNIDGYLILELDTRQIDQINQFAKRHGFDISNTQPFCLTLQKS